MHLAFLAWSSEQSTRSCRISGNRPVCPGSLLVGAVGSPARLGISQFKLRFSVGMTREGDRNQTHVGTCPLPHPNSLPRVWPLFATFLRVPFGPSCKVPHFGSPSDQPTEQNQRVPHPRLQRAFNGFLQLLSLVFVGFLSAIFFGPLSDSLRRWRSRPTQIF